MPLTPLCQARAVIEILQLEIKEHSAWANGCGFMLHYTWNLNWSKIINEVWPKIRRLWKCTGFYFFDNDPMIETTPPYFFLQIKYIVIFKKHSIAISMFITNKCQFERLIFSEYFTNQWIYKLMSFELSRSSYQWRLNTFINKIVTEKIIIVCHSSRQVRRSQYYIFRQPQRVQQHPSIIFEKYLLL